MSDLHLATVWEALSDAQGEEVALAWGEEEMSWREFDERAASLAGYFESLGLGQDSKIALYLHNGAPYIIACFAAFKIRAQAVNINYRYVSNELLYLLNDSDADILVYSQEMAGRVAQTDTSALAALIEVPPAMTAVAPVTSAVVGVPGAIAWDEALRSNAASRRERGGTDLHLLYTGGTTGLPKGVMYSIGITTADVLAIGAQILGEKPPTTVGGIVELATRARIAGSPLVTLVLPPLMHGTGLAAAFITHVVGGTVVLQQSANFDPAEALDLIDRHEVGLISLVGDAFGRPLVAAVHTTPDVRLDSLRAIISSGAMLSSAVKDSLLAAAPGAMIIDTLAASEGAMGTSVSVAGEVGATASFQLREGSIVLDEDDVIIEPGTGRSGLIAVPCTNPIGYYNDPEKTARTFRTIDGVRYSLPGDIATVATDGTIVLLGRGSHCINTGGEKVFPEEVEEALKTHASVDDALVFGVDDVRWGQRIEAIVSLGAPSGSDDSCGIPEGEELIAHVRTILAAYKAPKRLLIVPEVPRAPNGKADYAGARLLAASQV